MKKIVFILGFSWVFAFEVSAAESTVLIKDDGYSMWGSVYEKEEPYEVLPTLNRVASLIDQKEYHKAADETFRFDEFYDFPGLRGVLYEVEDADGLEMYYQNLFSNALFRTVNKENSTAHILVGLLQLS